jgi:hypothetical protein
MSSEARADADEPFGGQHLDCLADNAPADAKTRLKLVLRRERLTGKECSAYDLRAQPGHHGTDLSRFRAPYHHRLRTCRIEDRLPGDLAHHGSLGAELIPSG